MGSITADQQEGEPEFFVFARKVGALPFAMYAINASDNLERRVSHIRQLIQEAKTAEENLGKKFINDWRNPELLKGDTKEYQYKLLEIISKLAALTEIFLGSVKIVRTDYRRLPFKTLRPISYMDQILFAKKARAHDVRELFLLPKPQQVFRGKARRKTYGVVCRTAIRRIIEALQRAANFYSAYVQIYNKYKHSLCEILGFVDTVQKNGRLELRTMMFLQDYLPPKRKRSATKRPVTWGVITGPGILKYFQTTLAAVTALNKLLLHSRIELIHNKEKPFIPPIGEFLTDEELGLLSGAVDAERNFRSISQLSLALNLDWDPKTREDALSIAPRKNWAFRLTKHQFYGRKALEMSKFSSS